MLVSIIKTSVKDGYTHLYIIHVYAPEKELGGGSVEIIVKKK